jgi:hypothetical protein
MELPQLARDSIAPDTPQSSATPDVSRRYVAACGRDLELRTAVREATYPPAFERAYRHVLLDRPFFVPERRLERFAADLTSLFRMLVSLPRRLFGGNLDRYCAAAGIEPRLARLMTRIVTGSPPLVARSDAYDDGSEFKLLELNSGTELGGYAFAEMSRALLQVDAFARFAEANGLGYVDIAEHFAAVLRDAAAPVTRGDRPTVALVETTGGIEAHPGYEAVQEAMSRHGIDFRLAEVQDLGTRRGKLVHEGAPLDVAMRFYAAGEILECPYGEEVLEPIVRAHEAGKTILFTTLENSLFGSKGALALLSDDGNRGAFSCRELETIDRVVPWTRLLVRDPELLERCRSEREALVLKPCVGWGAAGTLVGRIATEEEWERALAERADGRYVVQRAVTPVLEDVCDTETGAVAGWLANWSVFVSERGYAGAFARALKPADGTVIAFSNAETRATCVFSAPEESA